MREDEAAARVAPRLERRRRVEPDDDPPGAGDDQRGPAFRLRVDEVRRELDALRAEAARTTLRPG